MAETGVEASLLFLAGCSCPMFAPFFILSSALFCPCIPRIPSFLSVPECRGLLCTVHSLLFYFPCAFLM